MITEAKERPSAERLRAFRAAALAAHMDPDDPWVSGYVAYEWEHLRRVLEAYRIALQGRRALEFGCNVGASGVIMAMLGADVVGVDVDPNVVQVANANFALHGVEARARALHVLDTREMPFDNARFDFVLGNSVLEYVPPEQLEAVMGEIHRVVKPGGMVLVTGTASRLALREVHSKAWLVNYLPRFADRLLGRGIQRGLSPLQLRGAIADRFVPDRIERWIAAREAVHGRVSLPVTLLDRMARRLGTAPGWFGPNIELCLRRL